MQCIARRPASYGGLDGAGVLIPAGCTNAYILSMAGRVAFFAFPLQFDDIAALQEEFP